MAADLFTYESFKCQLQAGACIFPPSRMSICVPLLYFLPMGQYGLCFGYYVLGLLLQCSLKRQATFYGTISGSP